MLVLCLVYLSVSFSEKIRAVKTKQPLSRQSVIACITCWQKMRGFTIEVNGNLIALSGFVVGPPLTAYQLLLLWSGSLLNEDTFCNIASCCVERVIDRNLLPLWLWITLLHQFDVGLSCWWAYGGTLRVKITIFVFHRACLKESSWTQRQSDYRMISTDVMSDFRKTRAESCIRLPNVSFRITDLKCHFNLEIKGNWNKVLAFIEAQDALWIILKAWSKLTSKAFKCCLLMFFTSKTIKVHLMDDKHLVESLDNTATMIMTFWLRQQITSNQTRRSKWLCEQE